MNWSFSTQAGFSVLLCFYISLLGFFSSRPSQHVEGLDIVQETTLVAFAFRLHSLGGGESESLGSRNLEPEVTPRDSGDPLQ